MKIGILGLGKIATRVAKGVQYAQNATLYAVASRDVEKAKQFQNASGATVAYGSYEAMLADNEVDMVYICTPNYLHKEHIMLCLQYRKHVICEKPMVCDREGLCACFAYAKQQNCFLMEAEKTLFTPLNQKIKQLVDEGVIGALQYIEAGYCSHMDLSHIAKDSWLFRKRDSGSFVDIGVYPICYANYFANAKLTDIQVMKKCAPQGIDILAQSMLRYTNGVMAYIRSSWDITMENKGFLYGDKGVIITENFWKNTCAVLKKDGVETRIEVVMDSEFTGEIEHAINCVEQGLLQSPILAQEQSLEILRVLEEMQTCDCEITENSLK